MPNTLQLTALPFLDIVPLIKYMLFDRLHVLHLTEIQIHRCLQR